MSDIKVSCPSCCGTEVQAFAEVNWSQLGQEWEITHIEYESGFCFICNEVVNLVMKPIEEELRCHT